MLTEYVQCCSSEFLQVSVTTSLTVLMEILFSPTAMYERYYDSDSLIVVSGDLGCMNQPAEISLPLSCFEISIQSNIDMMHCLQKDIV